MTTVKCRECGYSIDPAKTYELRGSPRSEFLIHRICVRLNSDLTLESRTRLNSWYIDRNNQILLVLQLRYHRFGTSGLKFGLI